MVGKSKKARYEIQCGKEWIRTSKAVKNAKGWLEYEIWEVDNCGGRSVNVGIARPGTFRVIGQS